MRLSPAVASSDESKSSPDDDSLPLELEYFRVPVVDNLEEVSSSRGRLLVQSTFVIFV